MRQLSGQMSFFNSSDILSEERLKTAHNYYLHKKYLNGTFKTKAEIEADLRNAGVDKIYYVLSFGGGTQSTHLFEDHLQRKVHYDFVIMSDTGAEPEFIHNQVKWWQQRQKELGNTTPFIITNHNKMKKGLEEMLFRFLYTNYQSLKLPVFCSKVDENGSEKAVGLLRRQCTEDFKIVPVKQTVRQLILKDLGLESNKIIPKNVAVIIDIGFSLDEINRINGYVGPDFKYMYKAYPLVEANLTTNDSIKFLKDNGFPCKRSRCYLCPFNCEKKEIGMDWTEIIDEEPLSFLKACWFDEMIREVQSAGTKVINSIPYLHHSRKPLKDVYENEYEGLILEYDKELKDWINRGIEHIYSNYLDYTDDISA